jgi:hypothetical protein
MNEKSCNDVELVPAWIYGGLGRVKRRSGNTFLEPCRACYAVPGATATPAFTATMATQNL